MTDADWTACQARSSCAGERNTERAQQVDAALINCIQAVSVFPAVYSCHVLLCITLLLLLLPPWDADLTTWDASVAASRPGQQPNTLSSSTFNQLTRHHVTTAAVTHIASQGLCLQQRQGVCKKGGAGAGVILPANPNTMQRALQFLRVHQSPFLKRIVFLPVPSSHQEPAAALL